MSLVQLVLWFITFNEVGLKVQKKKLLRANFKTILVFLMNHQNKIFLEQEFKQFQTITIKKVAHLIPVV